MGSCHGDIGLHVETGTYNYGVRLCGVAGGGGGGGGGREEEGGGRDSVCVCASLRACLSVGVGLRGRLVLVLCVY